MSDVEGGGFKIPVGTVVFLVVFIVSLIAMINMYNVDVLQSNTTYAQITESSPLVLQNLTIPNIPCCGLLDIINPVNWAIWLFAVLGVALFMLVMSFNWVITFIFDIFLGTGIFAEIPDPIGLIIRIPIVLAIGMFIYTIAMIIVNLLLTVFRAGAEAGGAVVPA